MSWCTVILVYAVEALARVDHKLLLGGARAASTLSCCNPFCVQIACPGHLHFCNDFNLECFKSNKNTTCAIPSDSILVCFQKRESIDLQAYSILEWSQWSPKRNFLNVGASAALAFRSNHHCKSALVLLFSSSHICTDRRQSTPAQQVSVLCGRGIRPLEDLSWGIGLVS